MASSVPNPDTPPNLSASGHVTSKFDSISEASQVSYQEGQLTWDGGKLGDEDIITITNIDGRENERVIWSLARVDTVADLEQPPFELQSTSATSLPPDILEKHLIQVLPDHLNAETHDICVLISTRSGTGLAPDFFKQVLHALLSAVGLANSRYHVSQTESAESVKEFAHSTLLDGANNGRKQTVLLLSGDGGIVDILNGLLETGRQTSTYVKPIIALLPLGTGNALFHSLHRPSTIQSIYVQGLRTLFHGKPRTLPVFCASFSPGARFLSNEGQTATPIPGGRLYGAVVASYGLHATLVADSDTTEYRKYGDKRFDLVAKELMFPKDGSRLHAYKADVTLFKPGGQQITLDRREHGYLLATPLSNLEKMFMISPSSKPLDGQLRIVHFGAVGGDEAMRIMMEAYNAGNHVNIDVVSYECIDGMRIDLNEEGEDWKWRRFCIDGLTVAVEENGWMDVRTVETGSEAVDVLVDI